MNDARTRRRFLHLAAMGLAPLPLASAQDRLIARLAGLTRIELF